MKKQLKKCIKISIWGILFELIIFMRYKDFSYFNYAKILPTYVASEGFYDSVDLETTDIPIAEGDYILELSYECTVETEWQLVDAGDVILCRGILNPEETKLQESFEIGNSIKNNEDGESSESIKFIVKYTKEGYLSLGSFQLNRGTDNLLTLQGNDFNCSYLGFQDGVIEKYYNNVGRQEFYGLNPYQQITIQNNTSDILYFDLNNCEDYENPQNIITAKKLEVGDSWQYYSNDRISYQVTLYSPTAQLEDISVTVNNKAYMDEYKTAVVIMMSIVAVMTALIDITILAGVSKAGKKYWNKTAMLIYLLGIFSYIIRIEPYTVNLFLLIPIFMIVIALLLKEDDKAVEYRREYNVIYAGIFTILITVGLYIAILNSREGSFLSQFGPRNGRAMLLYISFVVATILVFIFSSYLFAKYNAVCRKINRYLSCKEALLLGIMAGGFVFKDHVGTQLSLDWRRWQFFLVLAMLAAITVCLYKTENDTKRNEWALKALYLIEIIGVQINRTLINIYGADSLTFGETHHISAYYDEITYIAKGEPFRGGGSELYGHYAILWRIPMMIFGNNLKVVGIVGGIVAAITFFFFILAVNKLFRSKFIKIAASLALWCSFISNAMSGFSSVPHRYVFFSVIFYLMSRWQTEKLSFRRRLTGHLLCCFALIWNTESGICISLAWAVYIVVREIENKDNCLWVAVRKLLAQMVIVGIEIVLFFGSVEFYNRFLCENKVNEKTTEVVQLYKSIPRESEGSETDSSEYEEEQENTTQNDLEDIFSKNTGVLFDSNYMNSNMNEEYHFENQPAFSAMIFILLVALYFLSGMGIVGKSNQKEYAATALAVCVFGLILFSYSASRNYGDIHKVGIPFLIIFFLIFEKVFQYIKIHPRENILKNNIVYLMSFFMLIGFVQMELGCFVAVKNFDILLNKKNSLNYESMQKDMEQFAYYVPEGTYAYGNGIAEIYMSIGREMPDSSNTQYVVTDAWRDVEEMPYVKVRDIQIGRYIYTLYYNRGYMK